MPQEITVFKGDREITISGKKAYDAALAKGWSRDRKVPEAQPAADPQDNPVNRQAKMQKMNENLGGPKEGAQFTEGNKDLFGTLNVGPGFMGGMKAGINPFHEPPKLPVEGTQGTFGKAASDTFNIREIMNRGWSGDKSGAAGQLVGTGLSVFGPMEVKAGAKALRGSAMAARAMKEVPLVAKAARAGAKLSKAIKVSPEIGRFASRYTMPLFEALDKRFAGVHKALDGGAIPLTNKATQLIRRMATKSEIPAVAKIAEELKGRTALGYAEAEALTRTLRDMVYAEGKHWGPQLDALSKEIETGIDGLAKTKGVDKIRSEYKALYHEIMDLTKAAASTAKTRTGVLKPIMDMGAGMIGNEAGVIGKVGGAIGSHLENKIAPIVEAKAKKLAAKLGVDMAELASKPGAMEKLGNAGEQLGKAAQKIPIMRMLENMFAGNGASKAPLPGQGQ